MPLNAFAASISYGRASYDYDTLRTVCATSDIDDILKVWQTPEKIIYAYI